MTGKFQIGDRVRLMVGRHLQGYSVGDTGTVTAVLLPATGAGDVVYQVRIDSGEATLYPAFYAEELELVE
jgi:hypothetical protein